MKVYTKTTTQNSVSLSLSRSFQTFITPSTIL